MEAGYWPLYRYNPQLANEGKNPFVLDGKEPQGDFRAFLMGENRYRSLAAQHPELAEQLFTRQEQEAKDRRAYYEKLSKM